MTVDISQITQDRETKENADKAEAKQRREIMDILAAASGKLTTNENGVAFHPNTEDAPVVSIRQGTSEAKAAKFLNAYVTSQSQEGVFELPPEIKCRPMDGAARSLPRHTRSSIARFALRDPA